LKIHERSKKRREVWIPSPPGVDRSLDGGSSSGCGTGWAVECNGSFLTSRTVSGVKRRLIDLLAVLHPPTPS